MKTDNYLSLCLGQAAKSQLHYRHGCIIVRGGKVIGQGYNDYRPGYDGGSLKHGRVANGAFDGPAIAQLKEKLKEQKEKAKEKQQHSPLQQHQKGNRFVQFEGMGGGHGANTPLSMHSEMMAIHSALTASSTLSCSAVSPKNSCFKLPSGDKRKARLRRETLAAYVNAVCETAQRSGQLQGHNIKVQQQQDAQQDAQQDSDEEDRDHGLPDEERRVKDKSPVFHAEWRGEKQHHQKELKGGKKKEKRSGQYEYQHDQYGQQRQRGSQHRPSASEKGQSNRIRGYDVTNTNATSNGSGDAPSSLQHDKHRKDYKRVSVSTSIRVYDTEDNQSGKMRTRSHDEPPHPEPLLLPKGQTASNCRSVADREKHPRLNGADVCVARLGWCRATAERLATAPNVPLPPNTAREPFIISDEQDSEHSPDDSVPSEINAPRSGSGSLHDELLNPSSSPQRPDAVSPSQASRTLDISAARASRPCYRCITYMHAVGINRVFWTNDAGAWEGGKVRDLVDALDKSMENVALKDGPGGLGGPTGNGVFVTKHEVLMLKRTMERKEGG